MMVYMSGVIEERIIKLDKNRLEALTDGIFAFAMTLLVTSMILPRGVITTQSSGAALLSLLPDFYHYIIAFFVLAAFWMGHHQQFSQIKHIDKTFLFIGIIGLFLVTLVPFSTSFIGDYSEDALATIVFESNLMILGLVFCLQWYYATRNFRLVSPEIPARGVRQGLIKNLITPAVSLAGILITLAGFGSSTMIYMLMPLVSYFIERDSR
jgi:uncharacterized membrane protein